MDTHLFQMEFMETLGLNLDWFFDQWIYKGSFPVFDVSYLQTNKILALHINQVQELSNISGVFKVPALDIEILTADGQHLDFTLEINEKDSMYYFDLPTENKVQYLLFDKGNKLYKKVNFERSYTELVAQAKYAENMIDRYLALKEIENFEADVKRNDLIEIYNKETFYATKGNIVKQLANDKHKKSFDLLSKAILDKDVHVRRAVLENVDSISETHKSMFELALNDLSFVNEAIALEKLAKVYPQNVNEYLEITEKDALLNDKLYITWLAVSTKAGHKESYTKLVDFTSNSFEFRTRIAAINALKELDYFDENMAFNLVNAATSFNRYLSNTAKSTLLYFCAKGENKEKILDVLNKGVI
ncbi:MAG: hypothetical protein LRY27_01015 [Chitinophagales bacterium]|nr:hypothetical protein [Chitinophagales bacterium]